MKFSGRFLLLITLLVSFTYIYAVDQNEDLVSFVKPATVQIISSTKGSVGIPDFVFDYENKTISTTTEANKFSTTTIDKSVEGTGFIISSDGIIVTNSEILVGTVHTIYRSTVEKHLRNVHNKDPKDQGYVDAYATIYKFLTENSVEDLKTDVKIVRPKTDGYDAIVLYSNSTFESDDRDIALLKINADKLPSINLSDSPTSMGQKIYSMSYPLLEQLVSEPIFNQGIINTIKDNQYQTNIPSPEGSKGSPVIDQNGKVIGSLTSSGFVLPVSAIKEALASTSISLSPNLYNTHYQNGLALLENNHCKAALEEFNKAQDVNSDFSVEEFIKPKKDLCDSIIASGQSRDTLWDEIIFILKTNASNVYLWGSILGLFILSVLCNRYFLKRLRRDEERMGIVTNQETATEGVEILHKSTSSAGKSKVSTELPVKKVFDPLESEFSGKITKVNFMFKKPEKVEVLTHLTSTPDVIKAPKTIQPDDSLVVIAQFKTLNAPITGSPKKTTELQKAITTDLPPVKKEDMKIEDPKKLIKPSKRK